MLYLNYQSHYQHLIRIQFNFNKCCIWINCDVDTIQVANLFNFNKCCIWICCSFASRSYFWLDLTLTSVVFEFPYTPTSFAAAVFNFNKCCIWMWLEIYKFRFFRLFNFNKCCIWIYLQQKYILFYLFI